MEGGLEEPLGINDQAATEIAVITAVLSESPNTSLARWCEYRAYQDLVHLLRNANELPADYAVLTPDARSLRDWLVSGNGLGQRYSTEIQRLIARLQAVRGGAIDNICRIYCALKGKTGLAILGGVSLVLHVSQIAAAIAAAGGAFLFVGGLPVTMVLAYLLERGILDRVCDCTESPARARRPAP